MASTDVTPTHEMVLELVQKVGFGHRIFRDNCFTSSKLFSDLQFVTTGRRCSLISVPNICDYVQSMGKSKGCVLEGHAKSICPF
jgi:hypothetical protein